MSQAQPGYLFSYQVPPTSAFFSYTTMSTFFSRSSAFLRKLMAPLQDQPYRARSLAVKLTANVGTYQPHLLSPAPINTTRNFFLVPYNCSRISTSSGEGLFINGLSRISPFGSLCGSTGTAPEVTSSVADGAIVVTSSIASTVLGGQV